MISLRRNLMASDVLNLTEYTVTGNPVSFTTQLAKPVKSISVPLSYTQEGTGDPSPTNIRPITGVSSLFCMHTKKNMAMLRGYSAENKQYDVAGSLSNNYGTTISATSPESSLVITQSSSTTDYQKNNYRNGYMIFRTDNMVIGQRYDVSFKVTNITSNPLETALSELSVTSPTGGITTATEVIGNVVIWKNLEYKDSVGRQAWEFRNCGMSCTVSEFMVTSANTNDGVYEPYDGAKLDVVFPAFGKNLLDKNNVINGYFGSSGGNTVITSNSNARIVWMPCKPNTTYTCHKMQGGNRFDIYTAQNEPKAGDVVNSTTTITGNTYLKKVTTPENAKYLCMFVWLASADPNITAQDMLDSVMVEEGDVTPSTYEPFNNSVYVGSFDLVSGVLTLTHQMLSTTWGAGAAPKEFTTNERRRFEFPVSCVSAGTAGALTRSNIAPYLWEYEDDSVHFYNNNLYSYMFLPIGTSDSTELQIIGKLATNITIQLDPHSTTVIKGTNTFWTDTTGDLIIKYLDKA